MVALPAKSPLTTPPASIDAVAGAELDHTPLAVALDKVVVPFKHTEAVPVIAATTGNGFIVATAVDLPIQPKPLVTVYEIVVLPADIPASNPVVAFMVPIAGVLLLHTPLPVVLARDVLAPTHALRVPVITSTAGTTFTVTTAVTVVEQPATFVTTYEIVALPSDTPLTTPPVPTVAIPVALLLHTPPLVALAKVVVVFAHSVLVPVIEATVGKAFTVTVVVALATHPLTLVTVYEIRDVPAATPLTKPEVPTVATPSVLLLHTPSLVVLVSKLVVD